MSASQCRASHDAPQNVAAIGPIAASVLQPPGSGTAESLMAASGPSPVLRELGQISYTVARGEAEQPLLAEAPIVERDEAETVTGLPYVKSVC